MTAVAQPSGTVTLVFTDIEHSTRLLERLGTEAYRDTLAEHRRIVREACARHDGYEVDYEGDAFFYAFATAHAAVAAVGEAMDGLDGGPIRIRVGIHTGEPALDPPKYVGLDVHRAARITSAAHGGQVVVSRETAALVGDSVGLLDLGEHHFKDIDEPQRVYQFGDAAHPPLKSLYRANLPVPATPFLGREAEVGAVAHLLVSAPTRVVTLAGPGGTGKTRLAIEAAGRTSSSFADGITWVPLAPLRDPADVVPTIAQELAVHERPDEPLVETVARSLLGKRTLLVLDNTEHLLPGIATDVSTLAGACPTLRVLVTSRERLRISAETSWVVPTMSEVDGVELFTARARGLRQDVDVRDEHIAGICERVDHLPLAIELAAARVVSLTPATILERLEERLPLLSSRSRDVAERQRTLESTIAWSYDLLDPDEKRVLRALGSLPGGCTPDAARRVAGADLDMLEALLDKSLLRHRHDPDGSDRYWMLETIREFASGRLDLEDETEAVFDDALAWMNDVVGEVDEYWIDRDQLEWLDELERERANFMQVVEGCRVRGRMDEAVRLLAAAEDFVDSRGPYSTFLHVLERLTPQDPRLIARAHAMKLRLLLLRLGRFHEATAAGYASEALKADPPSESEVLTLAAFVAQYQGREEARALGARALELAHRSGSPRALGDALNGMGLIAITEGDLDTGFAHLHESREIWESIGDRRNASITRGNEAIGLLAARRPEEARLVWEEQLLVARAHSDPYLMTTALGNLAIAQAVTGDLSGARASIREAIDLDSEQFDDVLGIEARLVLALVAVREGDPARATALWSAGERRRRELGYALGPELTVYVREVLEPLRASARFEGDWERGSVLAPEEAIDLGLRPPREGGGAA